MPAHPDLQVAKLAVTNTAFKSGNKVGIVCQDQNSGSASVTNSFWDDVSVVNLDTGRSLANSVIYYDVNVSGAIAAGQPASRRFSFILPNGTNGTGHLLIAVNLVASGRQSGPCEFIPVYPPG